MRLVAGNCFTDKEGLFGNTANHTDRCINKIVARLRPERRSVPAIAPFLLADQDGPDPMRQCGGVFVSAIQINDFTVIREVKPQMLQRPPSATNEKTNWGIRPFNQVFQYNTAKLVESFRR